MKSRTRIFVLLFLAFHVLAAVGVWWAMPGGFPIGHARFLANRLVPAVVIAYAGAIFVLAARKQWPVVAAMLLGSPISWIGAAVSGMLIFPISGRWPAVVAMVAAITVLLAIRRHFASVWPSGGVLAACMIVLLPLGAVLPPTQRGSPPDTRPDGPPLPEAALEVLDVRPANERVNAVATLSPSAALVMTEQRPYRIEIQPLLTFADRSPDRCWTNLSPEWYRTNPRRQLCATPATIQFDHPAHYYVDDGWSLLEASDAGPTAVRIDGMSVLRHPVYSHLNTLNQIRISGHQKLSLIFSPAPTIPIEVTYNEYPVGKPERSAYLGADGIFRVVEATSGEKGPFHELASGPLRRGQGLGITLLDNGVPFARLSFRDFSAQAGDQLSPTAGWGYPVNSIEFFLASEKPDAMASIFMSFASTSVGRGWDSVGHAPGSYRNTVGFEYLLRP